MEHALPVGFLCLIEAAQVVNQKLKDGICDLNPGVRDPPRPSGCAGTHKTLDQLLQGIFATAFLFFLVFLLIPDVLVSEFMYDFHNVNDDINVLVTQQTNETFDRA